LYGKTKEKAYTASDPDFGEESRGKNLKIKNSLNWTKTSVARFHEHLTE
jgi:hypothetical protein